uniref:Uncharacterized protein n=1 Tax=Romanomermis culicivorax TaxID=13658 RepID=A0A915L5W4_ROMCU
MLYGHYFYYLEGFQEKERLNYGSDALYIRDPVCYKSYITAGIELKRELTEKYKMNQHCRIKQLTNLCEKMRIARCFRSDRHLTSYVRTLLNTETRIKNREKKKTNEKLKNVRSPMFKTGSQIRSNLKREV